MLSKVALMKLATSVDRRSCLEAMRRSPLEKVATWYSHTSVARSCSECSLLEASRGPYTATSTLVLPCSQYPDPSALLKRPILHLTLRNSFDLLPSTLNPSYENTDCIFHWPRDEKKAPTTNKSKIGPKFFIARV